MFTSALKTTLPICISSLKLLKTSSQSRSLRYSHSWILNVVPIDGHLRAVLHDGIDAVLIMCSLLGWDHK